MQNQNNYNRQGSNYYQQQPSGQPNQMSQQPYGQQPSGQPNQMSQQPYGQQPPYPQQQYNQPNQMSQPPYPQYGQQPPYGQPPQNQPPYGQQPPYTPQQGSNMPQQYGQYMNQNQNDIPNFRLIGRGRGIDEKEYYVITHSAADCLNAKEDPLSNGIIKKIKNALGGEWMVFASVEGLKGYDFSLSIVTGNDFLSFTIQNFRFQVCRLRD